MMPSGEPTISPFEGDLMTAGHHAPPAMQAARCERSGMLEMASARSNVTKCSSAGAGEGRSL